MSDESKTPNYQEQPAFNPFWGLDLGERWGREFGRLETKLDVLDLKTDNMGKTIRAMQADLLDFKAEMAEFRAETKAEFAAVRSDTKTEFAAVRSDTKAEFAAVRSDTKSLRENQKSTRALLVGLWVTVIAGIILEYFK